MKLLNIFKTYKTYKTWKSIIKFNQLELTKRRFLINWIYQLGFIIELSEEDVRELEVLYSYNPYLERGVIAEGPEKQFANRRIADFLEKQNTFFLEQGLRELIDSDYIIEESPYKEYTYYITLSFRKTYFSKIVSWGIVLSFASLVLFGILYILKIF